MRGFMILLALLLPSFLLHSAGAASTQHQLPAVDAPGNSYSVQLSTTGGLVISVGADRYTVDSSFSYPQMRPGAWNKLGAVDREVLGKWHWSASQSDASLEIVAVDPHYKLTRRVQLLGDRLVVDDTFTNTTRSDLAIVFTNSVTPTQHPIQTYVAGVTGKSRLLNNASSPSANPTIFYSGAHSGLGFVALDDYYKLQLQLGLQGDTGTFKDMSFGLAAGASYTFQWAIYPQRATDYYTFINTIRSDYIKPTTIEGGFAFMPYNYPLTHSHEVVAKWIADRGVRQVVLVGPNGGAPWIGGYGQYLYNVKKPFNEATYIADLKRAVVSLNSIDPAIKCLAPFETGQTPDASAGVSVPLFKDSVAIGPDGGPAGYHFPHVAVAKYLFINTKPHNFIYYPTLSNSYYRYVKGTLKKVLAESGVDGIYFDLFNYASPDFRWTYSKWDGHTVDVNLSTYTIARKKADLAMLSEPARADLVRMVLAAKPGNIVVVNGLTMLSGIRALPIMHFTETAMDYGYAQTALSTPIVLGWTAGYKAGAVRTGKSGAWWRTWDSGADYFSDIREKIESGNLYFTYWAPPGQMDESDLSYTTILSHMYPITVTRLEPGVITGRERIITLHSGTYSWGDLSTANAYFYDQDGRAVDGKVITQHSAPRVNSFHVTVPAGGAVVIVRVGAQS